ncbi:MAG: hypothetical protein ABIJ09_10455 [Pseudomonadota bacterium]
MSERSSPLRSTKRTPTPGKRPSTLTGSKRLTQVTSLATAATCSSLRATRMNTRSPRLSLWRVWM